MNKNPIDIDKVYNENCLDTMARMEDGFIDLTVTSPPYDNLRTYNGFSFDFEKVAKELFRVTKDGGVVVWVVGDATIKGSETGTSFRQALFFMECGFNLHDTMIWEKPTFTATGALKVRYAQVFEYMFIFVKGKIKTFNPIKDRENKLYGDKMHGTVRQKDGSTKDIANKGKPYAKFGQRFNVWRINTDCSRHEHPAQFPEQLAHDHIISWSNENDTILDPFMGSGTTGKMCKVLNRNFIGIELDTDYFKIAQDRIKVTQPSLFGGLL